METNSDSEIAKNTTKTKPSGTPPAKSSENNSSDTGNTSTDTSMENNTPPAMPECEEGDENCEMPAMPTDMQGGPGGPSGEIGMASGYYSTWHPAAYLGMGAGSVILSLALVYGCLSKFYREKPTKVFNKWQKIAIFCGASIALAAGLCVLCYFLPDWLQ